MIGGLILALSLAGIGLLILGERMGLDAGLAASAVLALFLVAGGLIALVSMTSRLHRYLVGPARGAFLGQAALVALLALTAMGLGGGVDLASAAPVLLGFALAPLVAPFNPWRNLGRFSADTRAVVLRDRDPGEGTRGALGVSAIASMAALALILAVGLPALKDQLLAATAWPADRLWLFGAVFAGLVPLLGGLAGLRRAALFLLAITLVTAILPLGVTLARDMAASGELESLRQMPAELLKAIAALRFGFRDWPGLALGFTIGLATQQVAAPVGGPFLRLQGLIAGLVLAFGIVLVARLAEQGFGLLVARQILGQPPAQWPVFVFDESLRGWLTACGIAPEEPVAAARACGLPSARLQLPAGSVRLDPAFGTTALALSGGLPASLGFIWRVLPPLLGLLGLAVLIFSVASSFAERVLFRLLAPRALRASRLAMARLGLIGFLALVYLADRLAWTPESQRLSWALLGLSLIIASAMSGAVLLGIMRLSRRLLRRSRPEPALPSAPVQA